METNETHDVLIIGGGPAGATAAIYAARADLSTLVLNKGLRTGSLGMAGEIANYPGLQETIHGPELLARMRRQAESFGARFAQDRALFSELTEPVKTITGAQGPQPYRGRTVIVATGSTGRSSSIQGEEEFMGRGVSTCATCDAAFFRDRDVAVAGNNDEALEEALFLTRFARRVDLFAQTGTLKASPELAHEAERNEKLTIHPATRVREVIGDQTVEAIRVADADGEERRVDLDGLFLYLQGRSPVTDFLGDQLTLSETGCVVVDEAMQSSLPGVFAVGDVLCNHLKQIVVAAGEGARAAIAAQRFLSGRESLRPDWS